MWFASPLLDLWRGGGSALYSLLCLLEEIILGMCIDISHFSFFAFWFSTYLTTPPNTYSVSTAYLQQVGFPPLPFLYRHEKKNRSWPSCNNKLNTFITKPRGPLAFDLDVLVVPWAQVKLAYAISPIKIPPPHLLSKIEQERVLVILIAPDWPRRK